MEGFNLLYEPWIPVHDHDGNLREVGIEEALLSAHDLRRVAAPSPLAEATLHRLLLAVLHRALGEAHGDEERLGLFQEGQLPQTTIQRYLSCWADRFELFHSEHPFYQIIDLPQEAARPWTVLLPEKSSGNNPSLFDHSIDDRPLGARPAEVAMAMLVHQSFFPGGLLRRHGVGSAKAAPLAGSSVFVPLGESLFKTLVLSLVRYEPAGDHPIWERSPYTTEDVEGGKAKEGLHGTTRVYTWLTVGVRLLRDSDGMIRQVGYGPGVFPKEGPAYLDPMCAYVQDKSGATRPVTLRRDRAFWRDFESLLPEKGRRPPLVLENARWLLHTCDKSRSVLPLAVLGQVKGSQAAKILGFRREIYPFPTQEVDSEMEEAIHFAVHQADEYGSWLRSAGTALARELLSVGEARGQWEEVGRLLDSFPLLRLYWTRLEIDFPVFMSKVSQGMYEHACEHWLLSIRQAVLEAWRNTVDSVGLGPRQLKAAQAGERKMGGLLAAIKEEIDS